MKMFYWNDGHKHTKNQEILIVIIIHLKRTFESSPESPAPGVTQLH